VLAGAPEVLLDSYHDERHPIGRRVLLQSGMMARAVTLHPRPARFLRNLLAPKVLRLPFIRDAVAGSFAGTSLRYKRGPGDHHLVGTRATGIALVGARLTVLQRSAGFALLRERDAAPVAGVGVVQGQRADDGPAVLVRPDGYICWAGASRERSDWEAVLQRYGAGRRAPVA
jgi:hypothetical protein